MLKVGDRVIWKISNIVWRHGVCTAIYNGNYYPFNVKFDDGLWGRYEENEIKPVYKVRGNKEVK